MMSQMENIGKDCSNNKNTGSNKQNALVRGSKQKEKQAEIFCLVELQSLLC